MPWRTPFAFCVAILLIVVAAEVTQAAEVCSRFCGDPNDDQKITVSDAIQILRSAASLTSDCPEDQCDADGDGVVGITDGVTILERAAGFPIQLRCDTTINDFVGTAPYSPGKAIVGNPAADLCLDFLPSASSNDEDIRKVQTLPVSVGNTELTFDFSSTSPRQLIIGAAQTSRSSAKGFYVLPVQQTDSANVALGLNTDETFTLLYSTAKEGAITAYSGQSVQSDNGGSQSVFGTLTKFAVTPIPTRPQSAPEIVVRGGSDQNTHHGCCLP